MPFAQPVHRDLDEAYCTAVRKAGSHGTWQPETWIWPGTTGLFRRGVFCEEGFLDPKDWDYEVKYTEAPAQLIETSGANSADLGFGADVKDPLGALVSAGGELSFEVQGSNEVLLLTRPGWWWEIVDVEGLLEKVRGALGEWPISKTIITSVFETPSAVAGISSRSTSAFVVRADAQGVPHLAIRAGAGARAELTSLNSARRVFDLSPKGDGQAPAPDDAPDSRRHLTYTPLFRRGYRVGRRFWDLFGRKQLTTLDGDPVYGRIARSEPEDLLFESAQAAMTLEEAREIPVRDLFEEVTPEVLSEEVAAELATDLYPRSGGIRLQRLIDAGIESADYVSVPRHQSVRLGPIRAEIVASEEESGKTTS